MTLATIGIVDVWFPGGRHWRPPSDRWHVLAAATLGMAAAYGGTSTIGVLIGPFQAEFGWQKAEISLAYVLLAIGAATGGLVAGRLADRFPTGPIAIGGVLTIGLGMVAISLQSSLRAMQATYLLMGFLGFSCLYAPLLTTVSHWFRGNHGVALGVVTAGGAIGQAFIPPLLQGFVLAYGWRDATAALGAIYILILAPLMLFIRKPGTGAGDREALLQRASWPLHPIKSTVLLGLAALFCCGLMGVPTVHLVSFASERGFSPVNAAGVVTNAMIAACAGRLATGLLVDRTGSIAAYALVSAIQTLAVYGFVHAAEAWTLHLAGAIYGFGFGGAMTALVCAVKDAVPARFLGSAMALVGLLAWTGMAAGGYQGGICFDLSGNFDLSFAVAAASGLANLATLALLGALVGVHRRKGMASARL